MADPAQTSNLTKELQQLAKDAGHSRPLLIGVEHEGGLVSYTLSGCVKSIAMSH